MTASRDWAEAKAAEFRKSTAILNICLAAASSPDDLGEALDMFEEAFAAALREERAAAMERAAKWHDQEAREIEAACEAAWPEFTPELGLHALKIHRISSIAIRAASEGDHP